MSATQIPAHGRVLAALDPSPYADAVADLAAWSAARMLAPLQLLHALEREPAAPGGDLSGNLALGSQESLLSELAELDARRARLARERGGLLLQQARARAAERFRVTAETVQRHGALPDALLELEADTRLFVLGKRGEHADFARGHLGSNLERVVRAVHRPVLVAARAFRPIERVLIAFDGSATAQASVERICASPLLPGLECHVLQVAGSDPKPLERALEQLYEAGFAPQPHVLPGDAETVIAEQIEALGIDLLVMGAYGHSRIRNLIVGSTTTQLLRTCRVPVLLLR